MILIPEIPYDIEAVAEYLKDRQRKYGKRFSIVCVAEGAMDREIAARAPGEVLTLADRLLQRLLDRQHLGVQGPFQGLVADERDPGRAAVRTGDEVVDAALTEARWRLLRGETLKLSEIDYIQAA